MLPPVETAMGVALRVKQARALQRAGNRAEAEERCREVLRVHPDNVEALHMLAMLLTGRGRADLGIKLLQRAIANQPERADLQTDLGHACRIDGRIEEAEAAYRHALELGAGPEVEICLAMVLPVIPMSRHEIEARRERLVRELQRLEGSVRLADPIQGLGMTPFHLAYHGLPDRDIQETIARFMLKASPALGWVAPHVVRGDSHTSGPKIRVGFVSAFFRYHTIAKVNRRLIERLDRARFHVTLFLTGAEDAWTRELCSAADAAVRLTGDLRAMQQAIARERMDVLLYVDAGMHIVPWCLAFARLAPVQCVSWGHPVTTGIPNVDIYISAQDLETSSSAAHYSERLVTFETLPTAYPRPAVPARRFQRADLGLAADTRLYVCPQLLFKLHPDFDAVLADILRRDPDGLIVLVEGDPGVMSYRRQVFERRFAAAHADVAGRLVFLNFLERDAFAGLLACADVLLDPPWFGGGNTTLEACAIGTPIVTWPGPFARGRTTFACLRAMDVQESVVASLDDYAERAVAIARNPALRQALRQRILQRNHVLYDNDTAIDAFEELFATEVGLWRRAGTPVVENDAP